MRQLVTIQKIHSITPIPGRDRVVKAKILGWDVVIGKDAFQEGELVCFAEIDSVFPAIPEWEELAKFRYRIKTFKVNTPDGPIYGQGYCFPISKLYDFCDYDKYPGGWEEGDEVTHILGVTKYEPPIDYSAGDTKGTFPTKYLSQTDETRLQSKMKVLEELRGKPYYITMKMDGTSSTFLIAPEEKEFLVCSRSLIKKSPEESGKPCAYWEIAKKYKIQEILKEFSNIAIQGEICGPKIQKNPLGLKDLELFIFNLVDLKTRQYLNIYDFCSVISEMNKIGPVKTVPILEMGDSFDYDLDSLIHKSKIYYGSGKDCEGIVIRPQIPQYSKVLDGPLSFKVINPEFLAKGGN